MADVTMPAFPTVSVPRTRPSGEAYTVDDREYWLLEGDGGIRRRQHFPYPSFRYRGVMGEGGKPTTESKLVRSDAESAAAAGSGWHDTPALALEAYEQGQRDVARAAAEAAHTAERMPEPAKREYRRRSAESSKHVTDIEG